MKALPVILLILTFSFALSGQTALPASGAISDIQNFHKVYVASVSADSRKLLLKELEKQKNLTIVTNPNDAEFFLVFKELSTAGIFAPGSGYEEKSELQAYYIKDKQQVVAWNATENYSRASGSIPAKPNETILAAGFLKAFNTKK